ncbi:MAG: alanine racemase C-terminal domain-containing protein, partial [Clostridia bacterium]
AQDDCFMNIAQYLKVKVGDCDTLLHISSTYSTLHYPYQCDMVRVGLGLYGYEGKDNSNLLPAKFITAEVVAKKIVKQGEKIGYDGAYCAEKDIGIAIINMGYSNGLIRSVADSDFKVKIGEIYAKFVGKICMNCCTVDISENFDKIEIGSEAEFLTDKYNFAKSNIGAIYELLCSFR